MGAKIWQKCLDRLEDELSSQQFNTWIRPLRAQLFDAAVDVDLNGAGLSQRVQLVAPNRFIEDWVQNKFLGRIEQLFAQFGAGQCTVAVVSQAEKAPVFKASAAPNGGTSRPVLNSIESVAEPQTSSGFAPQETPVIQRIQAPAIITSAAEHSLKSNLNSAFTNHDFRLKGNSVVIEDNLSEIKTNSLLRYIS